MLASAILAVTLLQSSLLADAGTQRGVCLGAASASCIQMCAGQDGCTPCHAAAIAGCLSLHNFRAHTAQTIEHAFNSTGHYNFVSVYGPVTLTPKIMEMAEKVLNEKCDQKELWNSKCVGDQATARCEGSKYALNSLCTGDQVCQDTVDGPVKKAKCVLRA